jgi:hypothetical protein
MAKNAPPQIMKIITLATMIDASGIPPGIDGPFLILGAEKVGASSELKKSKLEPRLCSGND